MAGGDSAGGSAELARLIDRYGEILIPELKHYFGMDLRDLFLEVPPWSPRYVLIHIWWLPVESAFAAEVRGGAEFRGWDESRYMIASLINAIRTLQYLFVLANRDPRKPKPAMPEPYAIPEKRVKRRWDKKAPAKPGSFAFIAQQHAAAIRAQRKAASNGQG